MPAAEETSNASGGAAAAVTDPIDVVIDKLLRYV